MPLECQITCTVTPGTKTVSTTVVAWKNYGSDMDAGHRLRSAMRCANLPQTWQNSAIAFMHLPTHFPPPPWATLSDRTGRLPLTGTGECANVSERWEVI